MQITSFGTWLLSLDCFRVEPLNTGARRNLLFAWGLVLFAPVTGLAASSSSGQSLVRSSSASGEIVQSVNFSMHSAVGQSVSGLAASVGFRTVSGYLGLSDTDGDGVFNNVDNCVNVANIPQLDTDADGLGNVCDLDDDNDGLSDTDELTLNTDPLLADSDNDGLSDFDEVNRDGIPATYQSGVDTDPNNPDTDGDGIVDGVDPDPLLAAPNGDIAPWGSPDGVVDAADLLIATRIVTGVITATPLDLAHGDVYPPGAPDGVIDLSDLVLIQQLVISLP